MIYWTGCAADYDEGAFASKIGGLIKEHNKRWPTMIDNEPEVHFQISATDGGTITLGALLVWRGEDPRRPR